MHLNSYIGYDGTGRGILGQVKYTDNSRFQNIICEVKPTRHYELIKQIKNNGYEHISLNHNKFYDLSIILKLAILLKQKKIDILNTHNAIPCWYGNIAAKIAGIPVVFTLRNVQSENYKLLLKKRFFYKTAILLDRITMKIANKIVAVSKRLEKLYIENERIPKEKITTVTNAVDLEPFEKKIDKEKIREELRIGRDTAVVGIVGDLVERKGHACLIEAARMLVKENDDVIFLIVGDGPLKDNLTENINDYSMSDHFMFTGHVKNVLHYVAAMDIFVLPSFAEGISRALMESMAMGLPAVCSGIDGNLEAVVDGETGFIFPVNDHEALADRLHTLIQNKEVRLRMGRQARRAAEEKFDMRYLARQYETLYSELIHASRRQADSLGSPAEEAYIRTRISHWDRVVERRRSGKTTGTYYHEEITRIFSRLVSPGQSVLELGCGTGELLSRLRPSYGLGVDFSPKFIEDARNLHSAKTNLEFICCDVVNLKCQHKFDVIIMSDLVNDLWNVQKLFRRLQEWSHQATRVIINFFSRVWQPALSAARQLDLSTPLMLQNWLTAEDITNLLYLENFEVIGQSTEILLPLEIPLLSKFANQYLVRFFPFSALALTNFMIVRPAPAPIREKPIVSVIVAARNEEGNIREIFDRVPEMGAGTELIFVEGHSSDDTYGAIQREMSNCPGKTVTLFKQPGIGKKDAVLKGFAEATGDVLMILDADLTVPPEDLPLFYEALVSGKGEFINGVRLVYPMEKKAMRFFNILGNKFFAVAFSWLLGQPIKDTLCGTKVLRKIDYEKILANQAYFGEFDPFGDFDLIFGAAKQNMKIIDLPVRYRERKYGETNISRWKHGILLFRMTLYAAFKIKFV